MEKNLLLKQVNIAQYQGESTANAASESFDELLTTARALVLGTVSLLHSVVLTIKVMGQPNISGWSFFS
ncbi:MAG: hypothetical protein IPO07_06885 [Haliscomenobacter sp.]|nr:hypothetical protein [Haliscomenobacter sp.]